MKEKKQRKKHCYYSVIIYKDRTTNKTVCRVPYKLFHATKTSQESKFVVCNSKSFKMRFPRKFIGDPSEMFLIIDYQGFLDGWYNPLKVKSYVTSLSRELWYQKFGAYNI